MPYSPDMLRQDALVKRLKGVTGGNRVMWSAKDATIIRDYVMGLPEPAIRAAPYMKSHKFIDVDPVAIRRKAAEVGIVVRDMTADDLNYLFPISSDAVDLVGDVVKAPGIDCTSFNRNPIVSLAHDTTALPIAVSSAPWVSGNKMMAIAKFPKPGISAESDQVAGAIRGGLVRGASIGFVPIKWSFSKDPARPFGVDFEAVKLLEWACCSLPCNQECLLIGAVSGNTSATRSTPQTVSTNEVSAREQRMAEAARIRRAAYSI